MLCLGMGAALLDTPEVACNIISTLRRHTTLPVSAKIRMLVGNTSASISTATDTDGVTGDRDRDRDSLMKGTKTSKRKRHRSGMNAFISSSASASSNSSSSNNGGNLESASDSGVTTELTEETKGEYIEGVDSDTVVNKTVKFMTQLIDAGVCAISIHLRTRNMSSSGSLAQLHLLRQIIQRVREYECSVGCQSPSNPQHSKHSKQYHIPIVTNGDMYHPTHIIRHMQESRCDGVMLSR